MRCAKLRHPFERGLIGLCANHMPDFRPASTSIRFIETLEEHSDTRTNLGRTLPVAQHHRIALWHFLCRNNRDLITGKFELKGPTTQDASGADLWRLEFPKLRSF